MQDISHVVPMGLSPIHVVNTPGVRPAGAGHGRFAKHQNTDGLLYDRPATGGLNSGVNPSTLSDSE